MYYCSALIQTLAGYPLQKAVLEPVAVEYAIEKFEFELGRTLPTTADSMDTKRRRKDEIDVELSRLAEAVATQGVSPALLKAIGTRETERQAIEEELRSSGRVRSKLYYAICGRS